MHSNFISPRPFKNPGVAFDGETKLSDVVERVRLAEEEAAANDIPFDALLSGVFPEDSNTDKRAALFQVCVCFGAKFLRLTRWRGHTKVAGQS